MRWFPTAFLALVSLALGFWLRYELHTHGGWTIYAVAPIVMFCFVVAFAIFLVKGGQAPGKGFE